MQVYILPLWERSHQRSESEDMAVKTDHVTFWPVPLETHEEADPYFCPEVLMKLYLLSV